MLARGRLDVLTYRQIGTVCPTLQTTHAKSARPIYWAGKINGLAVSHLGLSSFSLFILTFSMFEQAMSACAHATHWQEATDTTMHRWACFFLRMGWSENRVPQIQVVAAFDITSVTRSSVMCCIALPKALELLSLMKTTQVQFVPWKVTNGQFMDNPVGFTKCMHACMDMCVCA